MAKKIHQKMIIQPNQGGALHENEGDGLMSDFMFHAPNLQNTDNKMTASNIGTKNFISQSINFEKMMNQQDSVVERLSKSNRFSGGLSPKKSSPPTLFNYITQEHEGKSILNINPSPLIKASRLAALQQPASTFSRKRAKDNDSDSSDSLIEITASASKSRGDRSPKKIIMIESPAILYSGFRSAAKEEQTQNTEVAKSIREDTRFRPGLTVTTMNEAAKNLSAIKERPRSASFNPIQLAADNNQDEEDERANPIKRLVPTTRPISSKARVGHSDQTILRNPEILQKKIDFLDSQTTPRNAGISEFVKETHNKLTEIDHYSKKPNLPAHKRRTLNRPSTAVNSSKDKKDEHLLHEFIMHKIQSSKILVEQPHSIKSFIALSEPSNCIPRNKRSSLASIDSRYAIPNSPVASPPSIHIGTIITNTGAHSSMHTGMSFKIDRPTTAMTQKTSISKVSSPRLLEQLFGTKSTQANFNTKAKPQTPLNISAYNSGVTSPQEFFMSNKSLVLHSKTRDSLIFNDRIGHSRG